MQLVLRPFAGIALATSILMLAGCGCPSGPTGRATPPAAASTGAATAVQHVDAAGAAALLARDTDVVVLDIRTPAEFDQGHIAGAKNIDFNGPDFASAVSQLDRDKTYLVHCAGGGRSTRSLEVLQKQGFQSLVHLDGGLNGWKAAGLSLEQ